MCRLPVLIFKGVELFKMGGGIFLPQSIETGMIQIGKRGVSIFPKNKKTVWDVQGDVIFKGRAYIGSGSSISVGKEACLELGDNFKISASSIIDCNKYIKVGNDCLFSWDILIMDSDYHSIVDKKGEKINYPREIAIGNHVWIGCRCTILKGTSLPDNIVVSAGSLVTNGIPKSNCIIGGHGQINYLKNNINWYN